MRGSSRKYSKQETDENEQTESESESDERIKEEGGGEIKQNKRLISNLSTGAFEFQGLKDRSQRKSEKILKRKTGKICVAGESIVYFCCFAFHNSP